MAYWQLSDYKAFTKAAPHGVEWMAKHGAKAWRNRTKRLAMTPPFCSSSSTETKKTAFRFALRDFCITFAHTKRRMSS
jgi:hypothetical protein